MLSLPFFEIGGVLCSTGKLVLDVSDFASSAVELGGKDSWSSLVWPLSDHDFRLWFGRMRYV
jgi:hypothetical protein